MADEGKKISFGFAKSMKKPALKIQPPKEKETVDYIECIDEKAIKVVGGEVKEEEPLVIPLLGSKTWHDRILNKTDADIYETKIKKENGISVKIENTDAAVNNSKVTLKNVSQIKKEKLDKDENTPKTSHELSSNNSQAIPMDISKIKKEEPDRDESISKSLDEQAANEIIQDLQSNNTKIEHTDFTLPVTENGNLRGEKEATLEDYEKIPIEAYGLAMLRGMGWKPDAGIGKNAKIVSAALPELRPKGMGLGADKVTLQKQMQKQSKSTNSKEEEQLKMEKGSFVKIIAGKFANYYGQIEGFDDESGRMIVKMTLSGESQSFNEYLIQPVTSAEYTKNSKILNVGKYEEYNRKNRSENHEMKTIENEYLSEEEVKNQRENRDRDSKVSKKSKKRSKYSSDESTDSERKPRKRRNSSDSEDDYRHKKSKKSKKSHKRDSSSDRSRKKHKKRDKESDKVRERRRDDSGDRKKHKKHKRSRSRSLTRR